MAAYVKPDSFLVFSSVGIIERLILATVTVPAEEKIALIMCDTSLPVSKRGSPQTKLQSYA